MPDYRRIKIHRSYTVDEIARLLGCHKNTVRTWLKQGLIAIDRRRPLLVLGAQLSRFLQDRRQRSRQRCAPGEIYCVKCRMPRRPAGDMADYLPITTALGNLRGICPTCEILIHRRVSWVRINEIRGELEITIPQAQSHIRESRSLSVSCDSSGCERT
jgi:hypothetical protein